MRSIYGCFTPDILVFMFVRLSHQPFFRISFWQKIRKAPARLKRVSFVTVLQLEIGSAPDTNEVIGNVLQTLAPKEKTALFLWSVKDAPLGEDYGEYCGFRISFFLFGNSCFLSGKRENSRKEFTLKIYILYL